MDTVNENETIDLLIVTALKHESQAILSNLKQVTRLKMPGFSCWMANWQKKKVYLLQTGLGPDRASVIMDEFLDLKSASQIKRALLCGYAGALTSNYRCGDIIRAHTLVAPGQEVIQIKNLDLGSLDFPVDFPVYETTLITVDSEVASVRAKQELHLQSSAQVVDMETYYWAQALNRVGIVFETARVLLDDIETSLEDLPDLLNPKGNVDVAKLAKNCLKNPKSIYHLSAFGTLAKQAQQQLRDYVKHYFRLNSWNDSSIA